MSVICAEFGGRYDCSDSEPPELGTGKNRLPDFDQAVISQLFYPIAQPLACFDEFQLASLNFPAVAKGARHGIRD
ncbi:hypothetical protein [Rhodoferax ferrireducens]|uniref:hypothetical protein n=1 Tax=Rhodoferax ferrireducens TaxID=192843 RepID=UPI00130018DE|nr:hypothetical protein [Rhodoferax ferrireducens]